MQYPFKFCSGIPWFQDGSPYVKGKCVSQYTAGNAAWKHVTYKGQRHPGPQGLRYRRSDCPNRCSDSKETYPQTERTPGREGEDFRRGYKCRQWQLLSKGKGYFLINTLVCLLHQQKSSKRKKR